jgi:hypothetical protein
VGGGASHLSAETEQWAQRLEGRAKYLANQAWAILFFVLFLAVLAVAVFFFAASITKSDLSASDIDSKLNASTSAIEKLTKDHDAAVQDMEARAGQVAGKIKDVAQHLTELSPSKSNLIREGDPQPTSLDLNIEPTTLDHFGQIVLGNLQNPNPDGSISRSLLFHNHFAVALRSSPEDWRTFVSNMKDFAPLVQALDAYQSAQKKELDVRDTLNLNQTAYRKLYDKKSDAIAGLLGTPEDSGHSATIISLIATNVTRFGTLAIITFLISLSMSLYRYNIRLYAFYMARADALRMKGELGRVSLIALASSLTPGVDFGKTPQTPTEQIIELVRVAASVKGAKGDSED